MKIQHTHPNVDATPGIAREGSRPAALPAHASGADAVRLSGDLQLADRAVRAAVADEGRSELIETLRAQHARGELTIDAEQLADRMIDALLHSNDDTR